MINTLFQNTCPCCNEKTIIKWHEFNNKNDFYILYCPKCQKQISLPVKLNTYQIINIVSILMPLACSFLVCWIFALHYAFSMLFFIVFVIPSILILPKFFDLKCYENNKVIINKNPDFLEFGAEEELGNNEKNNLKNLNGLTFFLFGLIPFLIVVITTIILILD